MITKNTAYVHPVMGSLILHANVTQNTKTMSEYKNIPIAAATAILEEYEKDEVIIIAWDGKHNRTHITTDGSSEIHKSNAALGSNALIKYLKKVGVISGDSQVYEDPNNRLAKP